MNRVFYVSIDHLTDKQLELLGYVVIAEDDEFKFYRCYNGDVQMVDKKAKKKFLYVDDVNDAIAIGTDAIIPIPRRHP